MRRRAYAPAPTQSLGALTFRASLSRQGHRQPAQLWSGSHAASGQKLTLVRKQDHSVLIVLYMHTGKSKKQLVMCAVKAFGPEDEVSTSTLQLASHRKPQLLRSRRLHGFVPTSRWADAFAKCSFVSGTPVGRGVQQSAVSVWPLVTISGTQAGGRQTRRGVTRAS